MIDQKKQSSINQMHELAVTAHKRLNYLSEIKEWLDGFALVMEKSAQDGAIIDNTVREKVDKMKTRCTEMIIEDAEELLQYDIYGGVKWQA